MLRQLVKYRISPSYYSCLSLNKKHHEYLAGMVDHAYGLRTWKAGGLAQIQDQSELPYETVSKTINVTKQTQQTNKRSLMSRGELHRHKRAKYKK